MSRGGPGAGYEYRVVRDLARPGFADVALIRVSAPSRGLLGRVRRHELSEPTVLHHRTFRPMLELAEMEAYAARLEQAALHGNAGTFGCFVETEERASGTVRVVLYERWFDGRRLRCEELASREFDAGDEDAVVAGAECLAELEDWAQQRNDEREDGRIDAAVREQFLAERATERAEAARQLVQILDGHTRRGG